MKLLEIINRIFGLLLIASFFGVFLSILLLPRFSIENHNFSTPGILFLVLFFSFFIMFTLKPFLKEKSALKLSFNFGTFYYVILVFLLIFLLIFSYFILYLPMKSNLLIQSGFNEKIPLIIGSNSNAQLYFEFDIYGYTLEGTNLEIIINGPNNWTDLKNFTVGKKSQKATKTVEITSGTSLVIFPDKLPFEGQYFINFKILNNKSNIKEVRVFER